VCTRLLGRFGALGEPPLAAAADCAGCGLMEFATRRWPASPLIFCIFCRASRGGGRGGVKPPTSPLPPACSRIIFRCGSAPGHGDFLLRDSGGIRDGLRRRRMVGQNTTVACGFFVAASQVDAGALCVLLRDPRTRIRIRLPALVRLRQSVPRSSISRGETWKNLWDACLGNKPYAIHRGGDSGLPTFALRLAYWMPAFLERVRGISRSEATVNFGTIVVVTGYRPHCRRLDGATRQEFPAGVFSIRQHASLTAPFVWLALTTTSTSLYHGLHGPSANYYCSTNQARSMPPLSIWSLRASARPTIALSVFRHFICLTPELHCFSL